MNCHDIEQELENILTGQLMPEESAALQQHLAECPRCREVLRLMGGVTEAPLTEEQEKWILQILERTAGSSCRRAHQLLCERTRDFLSREDAELLDQHLTHCSSCHGLAETLGELETILPSMATIEPDTDFTAAVLQATSARKPRPARRIVQPQKWWEGLFHRPRFAWEVAYAGVLVLLLAFRVSTFCNISISPEKWRLKAGEPPAAWSELKQTISAGGNSGSQICGSAGRFAAMIWSETEASAVQAILALQERSQATWQAGVSFAERKVHCLHTKAFRTLQRVWASEPPNLSEGECV